jgi:hypothetical protein
MWSTSVLNNLFFYFKFFFCHGPKTLKKVCYPSSWLSIAVISLSGNTKETTSPERIQEYPRSIFLLREELDERFQDFKMMEPEFMLFAFPLKADIAKAPENLQMELINLQCDTNLNQKFLKQNCKIFILTCQKKHFLHSGLLG